MSACETRIAVRLWKWPKVLVLLDQDLHLVALVTGLCIVRAEYVGVFSKQEANQLQLTRSAVLHGLKINEGFRRDIDK